MSLWFIISESLKHWYDGKRSDSNAQQAKLKFYSPVCTITLFKMGQIKYRDKEDTLQAAPSEFVKFKVQLKFEFSSLME